MSKLIIIRGPSAAGKSAIAKAIMERSDRPTLLVEQDQFRPNFNRASPKDSLPIWQLVEANIMIGLEQGYDVIVEGILNIQKPGRMEMVNRIIESHPNENYIFYMDVSFEETLIRHSTRASKKDMFGAEAMRGWYDLASPMNHASETVIPENSTLEETVALISEAAGLNLKGNS
jgi:predicted kinase